MTLLEMKQFLRSVLGDNETSQYYLTSDLTLALNTAAIEVCVRATPLFTFAEAPTVIGTNRYPLKTDFLSMKAAQFIEGSYRYSLEPLTYDQFEEEYGWLDAPGRPCHYRLEPGATSISPGSAPGDLWLGPTPSTVGTLRIVYYQRTSILRDVIDDASSFELQEMFHRAVCYQAAVDLSLRHDDTSRAQKFAALYESALDHASSLSDRVNRSSAVYPKRYYNSGRASERRRR